MLNPTMSMAWSGREVCAHVQIQLLCEFVQSRVPVVRNEVQAMN